MILSLKQTNKHFIVMTPQASESVPYIAGTLTGITTFLAQIQPTGMLEGWMQLFLQAGLGAIVVLLLLKFFPAMLDRMEVKDKRHQQAKL